MDIVTSMVFMVGWSCVCVCVCVRVRVRVSLARVLLVRRQLATEISEG